MPSSTVVQMLQSARFECEHRSRRRVIERFVEDEKYRKGTVSGECGQTSNTMNT